MDDPRSPSIHATVASVQRCGHIYTRGVMHGNGQKHKRQTTATTTTTTTTNNTTTTTTTNNNTNRNKNNNNNNNNDNRRRGGWAPRPEFGQSPQLLCFKSLWRHRRLLYVTFLQKRIESFLRENN